MSEYQRKEAEELQDTPLSQHDHESIFPKKTICHHKYERVLIVTEGNILYTDTDGFFKSITIRIYNKF